MVKKIAVVLMLLSLFAKDALASFNTRENLRTLRSLDISPSFLKDRGLRRIYNSYFSEKRDGVLRQLAREKEMIGLIRAEISQSHIPKSLFYIAVAESLLNVNDYSSKGARGIWQFIPSTARNYGLKIDRYLDERKDPVKSTKVAFKYLSYLHKLLGKWYLVIMAYNAGEGRVIEGIVRAKVDKLAKRLGNNHPRIKKYRRIIRAYQNNQRNSFARLFSLYNRLSRVKISLIELLRYQPNLQRQYLPRETRNYIRKVVALNLLFNNRKFLGQRYAFLLNLNSPSSIAKIQVPSKTPLKKISRLTGISLRKLKNLNPQLRKNVTPPYKCHLYIPYEKLAKLQKQLSPKEVGGVLRYVAKRGDNYYKIAQRFGVSTRELYSYNRSLGRHLKPGQIVVVPLKYAFNRVKPEKGEFRVKISKLFHISPKVFKKFEDLKQGIVKEEQNLVVPKG
jgi:membrane-bound lytic murein transglycosylase D